MNPERYHLTLFAGGRPIAHGWWADEAAARAKFREWVGDWGKPGARVVLVDEETGETLAQWPSVVSGGA